MIDNLLRGPQWAINQGIKNDADATRSHWLAQILAVADAWRPSGYRQASDKLNAYYLNNQQEGLLEALKRSFPDTWKRLPQEMVLPVLRRWVDQQATVYTTPAARTLIGPDSSPIEDDDTAKAFQALQRDAAYWEVWQRLDRTVHLYGAGLLMLGWDTWRQRMSANVVAPHHVHLCPDPDRPHDISAAWAVLIELASVEGLYDVGTSRRFLAYWRGKDEDGRQEWQAVVMHEDGRLELGELEDAQDFTAPVKGEDGRTVLPMIWVQREEQHGVVYPRPPVDLLWAQDSINQTWVDIMARARTSGYGSYVATSLDVDRARGALNIAPGGVTILEEGESLASITADSRLSDHIEVLQDYLLQQAQRLGLPPSSWAPKDRPQLSGVALKVENLESELHRAQQINRYERVEEDDAWHIARAVWNAYAVPNGETFIDWRIDLVWRPGPSTIPTDEEAQLRVLDHDVSKNWLTASQAMSRALGITEQEAQDRLAANTDANRAQIRPAGMGLAEAALGMVGSSVLDEAAPEDQTQQAARTEEAASEVAALPEEDVAKTALNGAQIKSLVDLVASVSDGVIERQAAIQIVQVSFPTVDPETAERLIP